MRSEGAEEHHLGKGPDSQLPWGSPRSCLRGETQTLKSNLDLSLSLEHPEPTTHTLPHLHVGRWTQPLYTTLTPPQ